MFGSLKRKEKQREDNREENVIFSVIRSNDRDKLVQTLARLVLPANTFGKDGLTPLSCACLEGNERAVESLLQYNHNVNQKDARGNCPIHYAAFYGRDNIVRMLINNNADINIKGSKCRTALHSAIEGNRITTVKLLLEFRIDISIDECNISPNPLEFARRIGSQCIFDMLKDEIKNRNLVQSHIPMITNRRVDWKNRSFSASESWQEYSSNPSSGYTPPSMFTQQSTYSNTSQTDCVPSGRQRQFSTSSKDNTLDVIEVLRSELNHMRQEHSEQITQFQNKLTQKEDLELNQFKSFDERLSRLESMLAHLMETIEKGMERHSISRSNTYMSDQRLNTNISEQGIDHTSTRSATLPTGRVYDRHIDIVPLLAPDNEYAEPLQFPPPPPQENRWRIEDNPISANCYTTHISESNNVPVKSGTSISRNQDEISNYSNQQFVSDINVRSREVTHDPCMPGVAYCNMMPYPETGYSNTAGPSRRRVSYREVTYSDTLPSNMPPAPRAHHRRASHKQDNTTCDSEADSKRKKALAIGGVSVLPPAGNTYSVISHSERFI